MSYTKLAERYNIGFYVWFLNNYYVPISFLCHDHDLDFDSILEWLMKALYSNPSKEVRMRTNVTPAGYRLTEIENLIVASFEHCVAGGREIKSEMALSVMNLLESLQASKELLLINPLGLFVIQENQLCDDRACLRAKGFDRLEVFELRVKREWKRKDARRLLLYIKQFIKVKENPHDGYFLRL